MLVKSAQQAAQVHKRTGHRIRLADDTIAAASRDNRSNRLTRSSTLIGDSRLPGRRYGVGAKNLPGGPHVGLAAVGLWVSRTSPP